MRNDPELVNKVQARLSTLRKEADDLRRRWGQVREHLASTERFLASLTTSPKTKTKQEPVAQEAQQRTNGHILTVDVNAEIEPRSYEDKCYEILLQAGKPLKVSETITVLEQRGKKPGGGTVSWAFKRLVEQGRVRKVAYGVFEAVQNAEGQK